MAETPKTRPAHVLEDPSAKAVARVYARAFLDAARETGVSDVLVEFTSFHDDVLDKYPGFGQLLTSEFIGRDDKLGMIDRVVKPHASELFTNFLKVLARHDRLDLLPVILGEAWLEHERRAGKRRVQVKSAVPLTEQQLGQIKNRLQAALSTEPAAGGLFRDVSRTAHGSRAVARHPAPVEPVLIPTVDENLLGGLVIQVGDTVYDGSLRTRLKNLQQRLRERYLNEIQSGRDRFSHPKGN